MRILFSMSLCILAACGPIAPGEDTDSEAVTAVTKADFIGASSIPPALRGHGRKRPLPDAGATGADATGPTIVRDAGTTVGTDAGTAVGTDAGTTVGTDAGTTVGTDAGTTSSYDPHFVMSGGCNEWWIEVTADAQSVVYEREDGSLHPLVHQSWGSFAASDNVLTGTRIRLLATRADGAQGRSAFFAFLLEQPVLEGTTPTPPIYPPATTTDGVFSVSGRFLYDPCGNQVILRGVNKMNIWTDPTGSLSFAEIARTGANVVRIVWDTTGSAAGLDAVISRATANHLLAMVELHDATGNWSMLQTLVNYWVRNDVLAVVKNHESALLVNIGNEVGDGTVTAEQFRAGYAQAVSRLRQAGIQAPLVIDSTQWGYNIGMIQANGPYLIQQDPLHNLIFSTHAYWSGWTAAAIEAEIKESADIGLPMIVGEFAAAGFSCGFDIDYQAIMASCQAHQTGWIAWEWGPGNTPCGTMDMTTDNSYASLHDWGLVAAVTGTNSIKNTALPIPFLQNLACN